MESERGPFSLRRDRKRGVGGSESRSVMSDSATPWTIQSMDFSRPEYWSGWPLPSPGDLPNPGMEPSLPHRRQILHQLGHQGNLLGGRVSTND